MRPHLLAATPRSAVIRLAQPDALFALAAPVAWQLQAKGQPPRQGSTARVVTMLPGLAPATRYSFKADGFDPIEFTTETCAGLLRPEGLAPARDRADLTAARQNGAAIAAAIAALPKGGTLEIPPGFWLSTPVALRSDMVLHLATGATLAAPSDRSGWPILPARDSEGRMLGSWEGLPADCFLAPVHAINASNLVIEGPGILDGAGADGDWWSWPKETREGARRPRGLHLIGGEDIRLLSFTIRNAPSWTVHPQGCTRLSAFGLRIEAPHDSPNTDGFDPEMCRDVVVEGVHFSVGDDCIAVKAGKRGDNGEEDHLAEARGMQVRHCLMERGHGGLVIGSEMSGGVYDILVEDCLMIGTDRGLRLKTRRGRGGVAGNITMRRVKMDGVETAFAANCHYYCDHDGHDDWVQSRDPAPVTRLTPQIDGITIEDVDIYSLSHAAGCFLGLPEAPIRNIRISNLRIHSLNPDAVATPPIMADFIRPVRHALVQAEEAGVTIDRTDLLSDLSITFKDFAKT